MRKVQINQQKTTFCATTLCTRSIEKPCMKILRRPRNIVTKAYNKCIIAHKATLCLAWLPGPKSLTLLKPIKCRDHISAEIGSLSYWNVRFVNFNMALLWCRTGGHAIVQLERTSLYGEPILATVRDKANAFEKTVLFQADVNCLLKKRASALNVNGEDDISQAITRRAWYSLLY